MSYNFIEIGHTRKAVGFDGAIRLEIDEVYINDLKNAEAVFIETGFEILPYFPISIKDEGQIIAKFDDLKDREAATALAGKPVYLREEEITSAQNETVDNDLDYAELIGSMVLDEVQGAIGPILSIESFPQQEMMIIDYKGREIMVPLHPNLIVEFNPGVDIVLNLPEGILDI